MRCLPAVVFSLVAGAIASSVRGAEIPIPSSYVGTIDEIKIGDEPLFEVTAGSGGSDILVGVPGKLHFSGFAENYRDAPDRLLAMVILQRNGLEYDRFLHGTEWPDPLYVLPPMPPTVNGVATPIRVPIELDIFLPDSPPLVTLGLAGPTYTSAPGVRVAGTLTYTIGVPEPGSVRLVVTGTLVGLGVVVMRWRRKRKKVALPSLALLMVSLLMLPGCDRFTKPTTPPAKSQTEAAPTYDIVFHFDDGSTKTETIRMFDRKGVDVMRPILASAFAKGDKGPRVTGWLVKNVRLGSGPVVERDGGKAQVTDGTASVYQEFRIVRDANGSAAVEFRALQDGAWEPVGGGTTIEDFTSAAVKAHEQQVDHIRELVHSIQTIGKNLPSGK